MFPVLVSGFILVFVSCFDACFYSTAHAPREALGHTFPFSFILRYAFFLLFLLFRMARGILFSHLSLSGMPFSCFSCSFRRLGAYFLLFFHFWYVYLAVFETYAKMIDARHLTGLSLDRIFYQADCAWLDCLPTGLSLTRLSFIRQFSNSLEWHIMMLG